MHQALYKPSGIEQAKRFLPLSQQALFSLCYLNKLADLSGQAKNLEYPKTILKKEEQNRRMNTTWFQDLLLNYQRDRVCAIGESLDV